MTIILYIIIGMLSFYVGYVAGSRTGYRDGLLDSADIIAEVVTMKIETVVIDQEGRQEDEA